MQKYHHITTLAATKAISGHGVTILEQVKDGAGQLKLIRKVIDTSSATMSLIAKWIGNALQFVVSKIFGPLTIDILSKMRGKAKHSGSSGGKHRTRKKIYILSENRMCSVFILFWIWQKVVLNLKFLLKFFEFT